MLRVSIPWVVDLFESIRPSEYLSSSTPGLDVWYTLNAVRIRIDELYSNSVYAPHLRVSSSNANELRAYLFSIMQRDGIVENGIDDHEAANIRYKIGTFRSLLSSELGTVPSYLVSPKEGFDVQILAESGEKLFPSSMSTKCPESITDMKEAAKALVFELPTASGFHLFRVLESVLKRYWDHESSHTKRPNLETIGNYAKELEKNDFGDKKVWETLRQISKLHRNPLIHPEVILSNEEAIEILGVVRSAVGAMLRNLPDIPATTQAPSQAT